MGTRRPRYINVVEHVRSLRPDIVDPIAAIEQRLLLIGGRIVTNTRSLVPSDAPVVVREPGRLRGEAKLEAALDRFGVSVLGRRCLDLGASAGGFTRVLLREGAERVFAVDAGYGQLRGDLRADPRVVNLERTNLGELARVMPPGVVIDVVTIDLSYLSITDAVPQLESLRFASGADLVALVKPMFELHLGAPPRGKGELQRALSNAARGVERGGRWHVFGTMPSPVLGKKGAHEFLLHAGRPRELAVS